MISEFRLKLFGLIAVCIIPLTLIGCGENLFQGIAGSSDPKGIQGISQGLDDAKSAGDFQRVANKAEAIVNDPKTSTSDKLAALEIQGQALMGASGISAFDLVSNLLNSNSNNAGQSLGASLNPDFALLTSNPTDDNPLESLRSLIEKSTSANLRKAAGAFNRFQQIVASENLTAPGKNFQLLRGISNLLSATKMILQYYNINESASTISRRSDAPSSDFANTIIEPLMNPDGDATTDDSVVKYISEASDGISKTITLDTDVKKDIDDIVQALSDLRKLYAEIKVKNGSSDGYPSGASDGTIVLSSNPNSGTHVVGTGASSTSARDTAIEAVLEHIIINGIK